MTGTIAILVYDFRASGVVRNALRIAEAAGTAGLDVRLWPVRCQGSFLDAVPAGVPVEPILPGVPRSRLGRDLDSVLAVPSLARALETRAPALLLSAGNQMHLHAALALRRLPAGSRPRFLGRASNAVISAGGGLWRWALRPAERFQYRAMDRVVAVSHELAGDLVAAFGLPSARVATIPNGVDLALIAELARAPADHPFLRDRAVPVVLGVGRLSRQKNFEALLHGFALACRVRPLRLLILGPGSERRRARLRRLAGTLGVAEAVAVEGFAANPFAYMRKAGVLALTSRWEGASNVLLEAMACGCPVVAVRAPTGIAEVLDGGSAGPLVPPGNDRVLAWALLDRLARPRDAPGLREHAGRYDLSRSLGAYVDLLTEELAIAMRAKADG
jgi:glycosyltransferase involved in cell wall biosynthesis